MNKLTQKSGHLAAAALSSIMLLGVSTHTACAQSTYPDRAITIVVGYPPGGSVDLTGRVFADALAKQLDAKVVIENLGGAGGTIGAQKVIRATPDGYTLLVGSLNEIVIAENVNPAVKYNGSNDLQAIGLIGDQPLLLAASKESGITSPVDLVKIVESDKSADYSYGSSGVGTSLHLAGEMINAVTQGQFMHIPYRGVAPLVTDLASGRIGLGMFVLSSGLPQVTSGQMVPIGVTSAERSSFAPDIPALSETPELKDIDISVWFGLFAPNGLSAEVTEKLRAGMAGVLADPDFQEKYAATGSTVMTTQPDLPAFFEAEQIKFKKLAEIADILAEK